MKIYEITAIVRQDLRDDYERFMQNRHIPDLLATGHFFEASFERAVPGRYRIRYAAPTSEALAEYLEEHAPQLRQEFIDRFPEGIDVEREEWVVLQQFP